MRKAIAIDFDGCLCENAWPEIGEPHWPVIRAARLAQHEGAALILWTCRSGEPLDAAVAWCQEHGLTFDAINENLPERLEYYGSKSRKVSADEHWDDRAVHMPEPPNAPLTLEELREMDGEPVWCTEIKRWGIVMRDNIGIVVGFDVLSWCADAELEKLTFYRRKPEEGTT